jgi:hypothetical protein
MTFWRNVSGTYFGSLLSLTLAMSFGMSAIAQITTPWKIIGKSVIEFQYGEKDSREKIGQLNRRWQEITARLNPNQTWIVDLAPIPLPKLKPLKKGQKPAPILPPKQVTIRLQGINLLEVNEFDAKIHQAASPKDLAENWLQSLSNFLAQPNIRQSIVATLNLPERVNYDGIPYILKPEVALDRGLFRISGKQFEGKSIFVELPADQSAFQITGLTTNPLPSKISGIKEQPKSVYMLNSQFQFIPYIR